MTWQGKMVWEALPSPTTLPPRLGHTATLVGEKMLYVMGGREGETFMNDVWTFDCEVRRVPVLFKRRDCCLPINIDSLPHSSDLVHRLIPTSPEKLSLAGLTAQM